MFMEKGVARRDIPRLKKSLKRSLRKAAADFPVDVLRNSIHEWPERLKDYVRANGGHFE